MCSTLLKHSLCLPKNIHGKVDFWYITSLTHVSLIIELRARVRSWIYLQLFSVLLFLSIYYVSHCNVFFSDFCFHFWFVSWYCFGKTDTTDISRSLCNEPISMENVHGSLNWSHPLFSVHHQQSIQVRRLYHASHVLQKIYYYMYLIFNSHYRLVAFNHCQNYLSTLYLVLLQRWNDDRAHSVHSGSHRLRCTVLCLLRG